MNGVRLIVLSALLGATVPSFATSTDTSAGQLTVQEPNSLSFDMAREVYSKLEPQIYAAWTILRTGYYANTITSFPEFFAEVAKSLSFLDSSGHMRAVLSAGALYENWGSYEKGIKDSKTPGLDKVIYMDKSYRDDIYGILVTALRLCVSSGACAKGGMPESLLDQYYPFLHVNAPMVGQLRTSLNNGTSFALKETRDLPKPAESAFSVELTTWGTPLLSGLGFAQTTAWLTSAVAHAAVGLGIGSVQFASRADASYASVAAVRGPFVALYFTALGWAERQTVVDYVHYFYKKCVGETVTAQPGRDEL